jgi:steroid delta-isomerase
VNARDAEAVMALYADEPTVEDPIGSPPKVGREAVRAFYVQSFRGPFSVRRLGPITVVGHRAAFQFRIDVPVGDSVIKLTATDVMTFDEQARIVTMAAYGDAEADPDAEIGSTGR